MFKMKLPFVLTAVIFFLWMLAHEVGITYGTQNLPLHQSYVGDEQSPVNGALHMLQEKSLLGLRNITTLYYGPVFAAIALPAVVGDFVYQCATERVCSPEAYRDSILWDWGGIVAGIRTISVLTSAIGLYILYLLFMTKTFNPLGVQRYALLGVGLVACNYYYFQYSHFFKHWLFVLVILFAQIYFAIRIKETEGKKVSLWWIHGALSVASFGISYISAMYMVAFLPMAYTLWRRGERVVRKYLILYAGGSILGYALVLWWHPYAFVRLLGFVGVGEQTGGLGTSQNPLAEGASSWGYYGTEIILNHAPVVLAFGILLFVLKRKNWREHVEWLWVCGSIALATLLLFAPSEHHEGRYMLPVILMLLIAVTVAWIRYRAMDPLRSKISTVVCVLFVFYTLYHGVHIVKWMEIYAQGPVEQKLIAEVLRVQSESDKPVALVQGYIAGHVHTKEAYEAYIEKRGREDVNLYKAILTTPLPGDVDPINVRYIWPSEYEENPSIIDEHGVVYRFIVPREGELNQFDYVDEKLLRIWYWNELMPRFERVK